MNSAYAQWWDFVQANGKWDWNPTDSECRRILSGLRVFDGKHEHTTESTNGVIIAFAKGKELIETALKWEDAIVGGRGTDTDRHRGAQWRLVIAWSGLENVIKAACNSKKTYRRHVEQFLQPCELSAYQPLNPPSRRRANLEHWIVRAQGGQSSEIHRFLGLTGEDVVQVIQAWLVAGAPVGSWLDAMVLAKAFRHVSAHGALSATKIGQWGLRRAFDRLIVEIGLVAASAFRRIVTDCGDGQRSGMNRSRDGRMRALSVRQPDAEAIMRGIKSVDRRTQATNIFGRVYIYASRARYTPGEEAEMLSEYSMEDVSCDDLRRGVVIGTVYLCDCVATEGAYLWHMRNPERAKRPRVPTHPPKGLWFTPF
jgi:hypothetical protein